MTNIDLNIEPLRTTHQSAVRILKNRKTGQMFVGRPKNSEAAKYKKRLVELIKEKLPKNFIKYTDAVSIKVTLWFTLPKSRLKQFKKTCVKPLEQYDATWFAPMTVKPDWDNSSKLICDALVDAGVISDDNIIYSGTLEKYEQLTPGRIQITIQQPYKHD